MTDLIDTKLPLNLSHQFQLTDDLSLTAAATSRFAPLAMSSLDDLKPTTAIVTLKLEF